MEDRIASRSRTVGYLLMIALLIAVAVFSFLGRGDEKGERLELHSEGYLTLRDSRDQVTDISYADITAVEFYANPDYGAPVMGGTEDGIREGLWQSEALGEYTACASEKIRSCVLIQVRNARYAVNYESDAATKALCNALKEAIRQ